MRRISSRDVPKALDDLKEALQALRRASYYRDWEARGDLNLDLWDAIDDAFGFVRRALCELGDTTPVSDLVEEG